MNIVICLDGVQAEPWLHGLRAALPQASVSIWQPGTGQCAEYAVVWRPPQALLDDQPQLKALFNAGAGVDPILKLKLPTQTQVVRLDDAGMAVQMAEYVCQAVIRHFREFAEHEQTLADGIWTAGNPRVRSDFPVGVMGLGVLGSRVARTLTAFDFQVNGWSRTPHAVDGVQTFAGADEFDAFLAASRILVCLLPLTPQTESILNRRTLSRLQRGAYLVNVARGAHLVDDDLLALIAEGQMAGATLDVFRQEPLPQGHPFIGHPRLVLTPHISAMTMRDDSIRQIAGQMLALRDGRPVRGLVERQRAY